MPQFIETQFPIARLSAESYKERKAGAGQTLTGLGKWWGRKPLILARAVILGMLMPASDDPKKDRDIFLKILTMDDDGSWQRWKPGNRFKLDELQELITPSELQQWNDLRNQSKDIKVYLGSLQDRAFFRLPYSERIRRCFRPEEVEGPSEKAWKQINQHLGTTADNLGELVGDLGQRLFGKTPKVGDCFCGGGSIPFEAARIGCEAFGSDLNPVASLLTWASLNLLGGGEKVQQEVKRVQEEAFAEADRQITEWGIEHNERGERAEAYLYCVEVKPEGCEYYIPLAPNWVISEKYRIICEWSYEPGSDRMKAEVKEVSSAELRDYKNSKGATVVNNRVQDPLNPEQSWSIESLRGVQGLRRWTNQDFFPRSDDVFQERLYCIRLAKTESTKDSKGQVKTKLVRRYAAPDATDLQLETRVFELLSERFKEWQIEGYIPSRKIPDSGVETDRLFRERGWTHWHQLFTPRQLLVYGTYIQGIERCKTKFTKIAILLKNVTQTNWNSKLNVWNPNLAKGGGAGYSEQTFANQALNTLFNYGTRSFGNLQESLTKEFTFKDLKCQETLISCLDARDLKEDCDLWITDPPYADAVNYHELGDFFLAWYDKQLAKAFPEWVPDSRAELAVKGDDEDFRRSMVEIYKNLAKHMPDNGLQLVMFTHQNPAVWADLGMILWASGLKATAAWTIATETSAGLKKGNYVQGTVCLVLRKRIGNKPGFLDEMYPLVEDEVKLQIDSMQALDEEGEPNFNDADYQLAAYASALKVLTQFGTIDGRDIEHEAFAVRGKKEKSDFQAVIERALSIACETLIPRNLENVWRKLSLVERYYLRSLDIESRGERRKGMYEELARGFGVTEVKPLLKSDKANGARMYTPSGFEKKLLESPEASEKSTPPIPGRKGRASPKAPHPFAASPLRHLLFAIHETGVAGNHPESGRQYLYDTFGITLYWNQREHFIYILDWLSNIGDSASMHDWSADSESARILAGRLRTDQG